MTVSIEKIPYGGWANNVKLSNGRIELVVTQDVGPRIIRAGFKGEKNLMAELQGHLGQSNEKEWMNRGGHRLWFAPEIVPDTYELDNTPIAISVIDGGIKTRQEPGPVTGIQKSMEIRMEVGRNEVSIVHTLTNRGRKARELAPWALSVMAPGGTCIIPLPAKIAHASRLTHNQEWSIWGYTNLADGRWTLGSRYIFFRQSRKHGPGKLGLAQREGWVAYQLGEYLLVTQFPWVDGARYPDGGVNFETFSNQEMLEVETLGPLVTLKPGKSVRHTETWRLFKGIKPIKTETDADKIAKLLL